MRAYGVQSGGDTLEQLDVPEPHAGVGEIRIRVAASTVNPTDSGTVAGRYPFPAGHPRVPGAECAGTVDEVGDGVDRFAVGDRVMAVTVPYSMTGGSWADHVVVDSAQAVAVPAGIELTAAATLPMNGLTAWLVLEDLAVPAGGTVAVTGAAGAFGGYVVQLAARQGLPVIADASESDVALVAALGADEVVARGDDVATRIREVAPDGVDGLADGAVLGEKIIPAVRDRGTIATVRGWRGQVERGIEVRPTLVYNAANRTDALHALAALAADGSLTLRVADVLPAGRAQEALDRLAAGGVRGRLVLDFS